MVQLHQIAAAIYLAAGVGALLAVSLPSRRMARGAAAGIALGFAVHALALASIHVQDPPPPLTDLPAALSWVAWVGNGALLVVMWRWRMTVLAAVSGPISFLATFVAALRLPHSVASEFGSGSVPHAHVLLASAGLALLGLAGIAGLFFLVEHRRLKAKRAPGRGARLPSLEALDRVNRSALAVGFALLTLGVLSGMLWLEGTLGTVWRGTPHETWCVVAWFIYVGLAAARFFGRQGARQAAASALAGAVFLAFAVVGVGILV